MTESNLPATLTTRQTRPSSVPAPAPRPTTRVAVEGLTPAEVDLVKRTVADGTSDDELKLFLEVARRSGLDPFCRQIHAVMRWDGEKGRKVMTIQTGIDGLRLIAHRSGLYDGRQGPEFCGADGTWSELWLSKTPPVAARCSVAKKGVALPFTAVAMWAEVAGTKKGGDLTAMWRDKPVTMLGKCAEAAALRAAFPAETVGLYIPEEMNHDVRPADPVAVLASRPDPEPEVEVYEAEIVVPDTPVPPGFLDGIPAPRITADDLKNAMYHAGKRYPEVIRYAGNNLGSRAGNFPQIADDQAVAEQVLAWLQTAEEEPF